MEGVLTLVLGGLGGLLQRLSAVGDKRFLGFFDCVSHGVGVGRCRHEKSKIE